MLNLSIFEKNHKKNRVHTKFVYSLIHGKIFREDITPELINTDAPEWNDLGLKKR